MMKSDTLNWHDYGGYTKTTAPSSNVYSMDEDESKRIIVHKTLSQNFSVNKDESKISIVNEKFIAELFRGNVQTMFNGDRQIRIHYYGTKRRRE